MNARRMLLWLLLSCSLFAACAPVITKILASVQGDPWVEVCGSSGTMQLVLQQEEPQSPSESSAINNHCGYCLLQQYSPFIPTAEHRIQIAPAAQGRIRIGAVGTTIFKRFIRQAHHTRAPPTFS